MKIIKNFLVLFLVILSVHFGFASDDCEAAKRAILNDCDTIEAYCDNATNKLRTAVVALRNATVQTSYYYNGSSSIPSVNYGSLNDTALYDNSGNSLGVTVGYYVSEIDRALASVSSIYPQIQDIRNRVNAVQCSGSNTCNCAEYLSPIRDDLRDVNSLLTEYLNLYEIYLAQIYEDIYNNFHDLDLSDKFDNIFDYYNYITNSLSSLPSGTMYSFSPLFRILSYSNNISSIDNRHLGLFNSLTAFRNPTYSFVTRAEDYFWNSMHAFASLNNFAYSNTLAISSIYKSSVSNNVAFSTVSRILDRGFDGVTNQFSIFIGASAGASPVLGDYTSNDGSYHDYLTNYYIKVSGSSVSGSTPLTNWFNRIEMLLAALVFQDDDGPNTNSIPGSSSYDNLESELNQNMTTINQQGQDYLTTVDTSGRSLISMLREWNSAVSGVSRPSSFVVASIPTQASPSRSGSSLDITLDTDNQSLSSFVELVRGVTTLIWVTLFLVFGYFLSIRIITIIGKLISFGYSVYSAVFGGS